MDISSVLSEEVLNHLFKEIHRTSCITADGFILPQRYNDFEDTIRDFEVFDSDIWITGFPRTGTTWMSEIAWLVLHNFDYEGAKVGDMIRTRWMEFSVFYNMKKSLIYGDFDDGEELNSFVFAKEQIQPRMIKSHLPFSLLPQQIRDGSKKPKIIYVARNPMDTSISCFYYHKNYEGFKGTIDEFYKLFLSGKVKYGPFHKHVLSFWEMRERPNILFITFEEINRDLPGVIKKVADLLEKTVTDKEIEKLQHYVSFEKMKANPAVCKGTLNKYLQKMGVSEITPFIRSGKVGGYKNTMSPEIMAQFEYWAKKKFEDSGLDL